MNGECQIAHFDYIRNCTMDDLRRDHSYMYDQKITTITIAG